MSNLIHPENKKSRSNTGAAFCCVRILMFLDHASVNPVLQFNRGLFIIDAVDLTADVFCAAYGTVLVFAFGNTAHFFIGIAGVIRFKSMPTMRTFGPADVMPVYNIHLAEFFSIITQQVVVGYMKNFDKLCQGCESRFAFIIEPVLYGLMTDLELVGQMIDRKSILAHKIV